MKPSCALTLFACLAVSGVDAASPFYASVELAGESKLLIRTADGATQNAPMDIGHGDENDHQAGFRAPKISDDRTLVGWLSLYPNCCTSYPIPLEIVLQRNGTTIARFRGNGLPIWNWGFRSKATQIAFEQRPTHGPFEGHYELWDIRTRKLLDEFDSPPPTETPDGMYPPGYDPMANAPLWARGLE